MRFSFRFLKGTSACDSIAFLLGAGLETTSLDSEEEREELKEEKLRPNGRTQIEDDDDDDDDDTGLASKDVDGICSRFLSFGTPSATGAYEQRTSVSFSSDAVKP